MNFINQEMAANIAASGPVFELSDAQQELKARAAKLAEDHVAKRAAEVDRTEEDRKSVV